MAYHRQEIKIESESILANRAYEMILNPLDEDEP